MFNKIKTTECSDEVREIVGIIVIFVKNKSYKMEFITQDSTFKVCTFSM